MKHKRSCDTHVRFRAGCDDCNTVNRRYVKTRKLHGNPKLSAPAELTMQRIRELRALGYSRLHIAAEADMAPGQVVKLSLGGCAWVQLRVFHGVERAYMRLRDVPGPDKRAAAWAAKHGWTPPPLLPVPDEIPEDIVDEVAVARAVKGERIPLTRAETLEAWTRLEAAGMSATAIGDLLHTAPRTVQRWRSGVYKPISKRTA